MVQARIFWQVDFGLNADSSMSSYSASYGRKVSMMRNHILIRHRSARLCLKWIQLYKLMYEYSFWDSKTKIFWMCHFCVPQLICTIDNNMRCVNRTWFLWSQNPVIVSWTWFVQSTWRTSCSFRPWSPRWTSGTRLSFGSWQTSRTWFTYRYREHV